MRTSEGSVDYDPQIPRVALTLQDKNPAFHAQSCSGFRGWGLGLRILGFRAKSLASSLALLLPRRFPHRRASWTLAKSAFLAFKTGGSLGLLWEPGCVDVSLCSYILGL